MKFKHLEKRKVFENNIIEVFEEDLLLPNGNKVTWTFTEKSEPAAILGVIDGKVILVKQYRPATKKELLEIPAGIIEAGEDEEVAANREFEEETGYSAGKLTKICSYFSSPGISGGRYHLFFAEDIKKSKQHLDENEFLEVKLIDFNDIDIFSLEDPKTIIALNYYKNVVLKK